MHLNQVEVCKAVSIVLEAAHVFTSLSSCIDNRGERIDCTWSYVLSKLRVPCGGKYPGGAAGERFC